MPSRHPRAISHPHPSRPCPVWSRLCRHRKSRRISSTSEKDRRTSRSRVLWISTLVASSRLLRLILRALCTPIESQPQSSAAPEANHGFATSHEPDPQIIYPSFRISKSCFPDFAAPCQARFKSQDGGAAPPPPPAPLSMGGSSSATVTCLHGY